MAVCCCSAATNILHQQQLHEWTSVALKTFQTGARAAQPRLELMPTFLENFVRSSAQVLLGLSQLSGRGCAKVGTNKYEAFGYFLNSQVYCTPDARTLLNQKQKPRLFLRR